VDVGQAQGISMQAPSDGLLVIHEHLVDVCMDLVQADEGEDLNEVKDDFDNMIQIILEALQIEVNEKTVTDEGIKFQCNMTIAPKQ
jgi:DUF438 domain-containing protein